MKVMKKIFLPLVCLLNVYIIADNNPFQEKHHHHHDKDDHHCHHDKHDEPFWDTKILVNRKLTAENVRTSAAVAQAFATKIGHQKTNGDLHRYKDKRGSYSKALAHKTNGMVQHKAFDSLVHALKSGNPSKFNEIILGGAALLNDPQGAYAFTMEGADAAAYVIPAPPKLASGQAAAEMVELYWQALLRDVPFNQYNTNPIAANAIANLNTLSHFKGPQISGSVTSQSLFRFGVPGDLVGPYISQFLYQPIPHHGTSIPQLYLPYMIGINYLTVVSDLLLVENGGSTGEVNVFQAASNYIFTGRDLGTYVHKDYTTQAWVNAALILLGYGNAALDPHNPYVNNPTQSGFVTYGSAQVIELVNIAAEAALKACWYQKWMVHLRLRPENFGLLVQQQIVGGADYDLKKQLIKSPALTAVFNLYGTYLLPQMYPEGSPTHPSYPAGHAVIAGACATILKAFFNENFPVENPMQPNASNTGLDPYVGTLLVGDELNKLASNIGMGRDFAGVHYRSDVYEGMLLGEKIAISVLNDEAYTNNEKFKGFTLTKFNGKTVTVGKKVTVE
ncbi:MAG TPA: vanadium-dependent haloperoxidase [Candidatus Babeliales bacterium]|nr:vanadium-dependent haloperoxidase [Candidatus Babeliales bacterium]